MRNTIQLRRLATLKISLRVNIVQCEAGLGIVRHRILEPRIDGAMNRTPETDSLVFDALDNCLSNTISLMSAVYIAGKCSFESG